MTAPPPAPPARHTALLPLPAYSGLSRLAELRQARDELDAAITSLVHELSARGVSWGGIGRALRLTRQGARQKYGATR